MEQPLYLNLEPQIIKQRMQKAHQLLKNCTICPRGCQVNRENGEKGKCGVTNRMVIASFGPHFGEERVLTGTRGSGTIFFMHCNLECVFCQNWSISRGLDRGQEISVKELAEVMLHLQSGGCHNINLVSPTPYIPLILEVLDEAINNGLSIPIVYNCGGYENPDSLKLLEGIVDLYMPDAKYADRNTAYQLSGVEYYPEFLVKGLKEMHRQVGDLKVNAKGIAYRGLLVRHLVLPQEKAGSKQLAKTISEQVSAHCAVNVMDQYYPTYQASHYPEINRRVSRQEYLQAVETFKHAGLRIVR